ncbi:hypothetical protein GUITHDRAFT_109474 [Guillardia theta CCMP2712]|uniref:Uncharacterized protein n=1 Tax=Guillardia theta (strain CCMP2712) TaxID=905079 RepID=L1J9B4_GUITC|nr:hypothetical protein GUITHDRAFT_109474 [Guillardia theta CCMP2712]EKX44694.1 hypothetical protein GUITHDRAFT_109474 [Guillardia theta CCMP2712]|eukprot:XP_005831674.1 hypothetical protein GUITHDRAFT_109474 [Guillardia theta CCMP2712]
MELADLEVPSSSPHARQCLSSSYIPIRQGETSYVVVLPVHSRYQRPSTSQTSRPVLVPAPLLSVHCPGQAAVSLPTSVKKQQQHQREEEDEDSFLRWQIPVGRTGDLGLTIAFTLLITSVGTTLAMAVMARPLGASDVVRRIVRA